MRFAKSIIGQSVGTMLLVLGLCMAALLFAANNKISNQMSENFRTDSTNLTAFVAKQINTGTRLKRGAMIEPQLTALLADEKLAAAAIRVTHTEGLEIISAIGDQYQAAEMPPFNEADFSETPSTQTFDGFVLVRTPILLGSGADQVLVGELAVMWDRSAYLPTVRAITIFLQTAFLATALIVAAASMASIYFVIGRPISKTVKALAAVSNGQADVTLPKSNTTEIRQMVDTIATFLNMTQERAKLMEDLSEVISSAQKGDFSRRVTLQDDQNGDRGNLRVIVNELIETVDAGLTETVGALDSLSNRDLTVQMRGNFEGAFKKLSDDVNRTANELDVTVNAILRTANEVQTMSHHLSSSSEELSQRTQHNAGTLEETSASISLVAEAVTSAAEFANIAREESANVTRHATSGKDVVDKLVDNMSRIQTNSEDISDIVTLIDDIAFQTNLLALNAGVEAARAGEHGRGFAIVASEVRGLAQRTSESAAKITALVTTSATEVASGVEQANQAGKSITEIVNAISVLSNQITEISSKASEQAKSISEIRAAINELDTSTQQNASMVDKTSELANDMRYGSATMLETLQSFTVNPASSQTGTQAESAA